jgi:hypothetical protein
MWVLADRRPPHRSDPVPPRVGVAPRVEGQGAIAVEPDPPPPWAKDLEPKERI